MACAGCSFVGSYDARSPTLHCKYGRGSPGFLEPDPIGSASTANLDLSLSIRPLIPRTRFNDCRLKTPAKPISRCASAFVSFLFLLFLSASFSPLSLSLSSSLFRCLPIFFRDFSFLFTYFHRTLTYDVYIFESSNFINSKRAINIQLTHPRSTEKLIFVGSLCYIHSKHHSVTTIISCN